MFCTAMGSLAACTPELTHASCREGEQLHVTAEMRTLLQQLGRMSTAPFLHSKNLFDLPICYVIYGVFTCS